ncbi:MAG: dTDP-glucose 4,6-dehydratase [Candidatus Cloacimonadota bacterium]|nr:MAG: dTDP-glucose 4,6-dehydratase [Candidatus Cloacimonadota bacterium]
MKTILVTGGAGFIGSNFIILVLQETNYSVINFDKLTYAGNLENLEGFSKNYKFVKGDIADTDDLKLLDNEEFDYIVNFAAETHVDRSIDSPNIFTITNVIGTQNLLNLALERSVTKFVQISTDEVYGSVAKPDCSTETSPLNPTSPYSASKTAADLIALSYFKTYKLNLNITRCSNNYGPCQFPEKLIPLMINNAANNNSLPIYGDGKNIRDWIYVEDHCGAILKVMEKGINGEIYNIGGNSEKQNIEIVKLILRELDRPETLIHFVEDRKGHDRRYAIDFSKITHELGWKPKTDFNIGMKKTINWYSKNKKWLDNIVSGDYKEYYSKMYEER